MYPSMYYCYSYLLFVPNGSPDIITLTLVVLCFILSYKTSENI